MSDHDRGLAHDLRILITRRRALGWLGGAGLLALVGCTTEAGDDDGGMVDSGGGGSCAAIPEETAGPYPGDGTNGANALALSGIVRSDIRASIGGATGVAAGVPLTVTLTLLDPSSCQPLEGKAVYLWHCDRDGNYSMYASAVQHENYLRGVQVADASGQVTFTTIVPGCYSGRWPHIHFEIYDSVSAATNGANKIAVSQLALPESTCDEAYTASGYASSVSNFSQISLASDNVFSDGATQQIAAVTGSVAAGFTANLVLGVG